MNKPLGSRVLSIATAALLLPAAACSTAGMPGDGDSDSTDGLPAAVSSSEQSMRIPVDFTPECGMLKELDEAPADLTVGQFFACLTPDSRATFDRRFRKVALRAGAGAPADLDELIAIHGDAPVAQVRLRELAFGGTNLDAVREELVEGIAPDHTARFKFNSAYGLDPTTCKNSCLSTTVNLVGGRRTIGFGAAAPGATAPNDTGGRYLDEINPGVIPDLKQADLANTELQDSGCGPVSAINMFEWWGIPIYNGGTELTSFNGRANYVADRMDTLDGLNFTDDEELIDFVTRYPREMYQAGRTSGYPGSHYMRGNAQAWKAMMSYISRGYPVIALYSTSEDSLHWALVTGMTNGTMRIANATDRSVADFYNRWNNWGSLDWYADWASDAFVEKSTFVALTGWGSGTPAPDRFAARTLNAKLPSYKSGSYAYLHRYCLGATDEIGIEAEWGKIGIWSAEPSGTLPGYCMYTNKVTAPTLTATPSGSAASSKINTNLTLSVANSGTLATFIAANPGARCVFSGYAGGKWTAVKDNPCKNAGALSLTYANAGQYSKVEFHVHSVELAQKVWTVTATN